MNSASVVPAYGRDYKSKKEVLADFLAGKDFRLETFNQSFYFNIQDLDLPEWKFSHLQFRFKKLQNVCVFNVTTRKMV